MSDPADQEQGIDRLLDEAACRWLADQETTVSDHPEIEALISYQEGGLAGAVANSVRSHVAGCVHCWDELAAFQAFDDAEPETVQSRAEDAVLTASWRAFRLAGSWTDPSHARRSSPRPGSAESSAILSSFAAPVRGWLRSSSQTRHGGRSSVTGTLEAVDGGGRDQTWHHRSWVFPRDQDVETKAARILDLYVGRPELG